MTTTRPSNSTKVQPHQLLVAREFIQWTPLASFCRHVHNHKPTKKPPYEKSNSIPFTPFEIYLSKSNCGYK